MNEMNYPENRSDATIERLNRILDEAARVFESRQYAEKWIDAPNLALGGVTPESLCYSFAGLEIVLRELAAIEFGHPV